MEIEHLDKSSYEDFITSSIHKRKLWEMSFTEWKMFSLGDDKLTMENGENVIEDGASDCAIS